MPFDPEHAYKRLLEIMDAIEVDAKERLGGRVFALETAWTRPRKLLECHMYVQLHDNVLRGRDLDDLLYSLLDPYCNVRVNNAERLPIQRPSAAFNRRRHDEVPRTEMFSADGPVPIHNEAADRDSDSDDWQEYLSRNS
jgi:hypothetical protein